MAHRMPSDKSEILLNDFRFFLFLNEKGRGGGGEGRAEDEVRGDGRGGRAGEG